MAGIGEASAIIAVAQAGISLSMVIIAYVSDVRDAPKSVTRIGNEIKSTSGRLQEIAGIIEDNPSTGLLLDTAIGDATRCSSECELILAQVGNLLVKGGWRRDSTELSKSDIDASVVASLKWPFLKTRLETPRVELQRIKADLILLFNVAMARKSSTPLTNEYARRIPLLTKKKKEAARRAEEAKQRARDRPGGGYGARTSSPRASGIHAPQLVDKDPELYQQLYEIELQIAKEQEDRRIEERATLLQAEKDNKRQSEEAAQQEIAQRAVQDYKLRQEELKAKTIAQERQLGDELSALGLSPEQIASILAVPSLNANDMRSDAVVRRKSAESQQTSLTKSARRPSRRGRSNFPIKLIPWRGTRNSQSHDSENISVESSSQGNRSSQYNRGIDDQVNIELWLVDVFSRHDLELAPPERWMSQKLKRIEKSHDVWHRLAQLQPMWRIAIQDFLKDRNKAQSLEHPWRLVHIGLPRRMTKTSIFGHHHGGQLVRVIVSQRKIANQVSNSVVVVSGENDKTSPSTVNASTYLPRQLVSIPAIRESSYDCNESFELPSDDAPLELRDLSSETHVMIPEALTLKQVNQLASLSKSFMESGRVPWRAQPLFTYTVIENQVPYNDKEHAYDRFDYGSGQAPGRLAPTHELLENQQPGRRADRATGHPRGLQTRLEDSIDYLKQRRFAIGEDPGPDERVWFHEIDTMISVLERNLAKIESHTAKISDYVRDDDHDRTRFGSHPKPYPVPVTRLSEEERLYRGGDFLSRDIGPASLERGNLDRRPPFRRPSDQARSIRSRLNASLAERGLQGVPEDNLDPLVLIEEARHSERFPPTQPSSKLPREGPSGGHRSGSVDSEDADRRSFERTRPTLQGYEEIKFQERDKNAGGFVNVSDPIQRDEKRVVFKDRQRPSQHTDYDEKTYGRESADRVVARQPKESMEKKVKIAKKEEHEHGATLKAVDLMRPTYIKVHRRHLSPETLDTYGLPWEWEKNDSQYIIIKKWIEEAEQVMLFEHTKQLRERKSLVDIIPRGKYHEEKSRLERPKRGRSLEREDIRPNGRNSQALVLRERSRDRFSSHEHPSRKSTYDDDIRLQGYDRSPFPSPTFNPRSRPYDAGKVYIPQVPPPLDSGIKPWHDYEKLKFMGRPLKPSQNSRIMSRSWLPAPTSVESGDDDDYDDLPPPANDENDEDADLIAKTLSRYTTFKIDDDVTAGAKSSPTPEPEVSGSPTTSESHHTTSPLRYSKTPEQMKSSLEKMRTKKSRAEEDGDVATASNLRYYPISEKERCIKEEEEALRLRAEAKAAKIENASQTHGLQSRRSPIHSIIASPTTVEGGFASAQNVSEKRQKATPLSRVQRQGVLEDSATEEKDNRSGSQTSHLLKKMKSTADLRNDDPADPSLQSSKSSNHVTDHVNQNIRKKNSKQDNSPTEPFQNGPRSSTDYIIRRRRSRSPSQSESQREPVRRVDTRLYEADSEGSGGDARVLERRDTWRRPTVEDEDYIEVEEEHSEK